MDNLVTLEQVEALVGQLPMADQAKLAERLNLQFSLSWPRRPRTPEEIDAFLAELDTIAESMPSTPFDSAEDIRKSREERAQRI